MAFISRTVLAVFIAQATLGFTAASTNKDDLMKKVKSTNNGFNALTYRAFESIKKQKQVDEEDDDTRHLTGTIKTANKWKKKYEQCKAKQDEPSFLYIQMADHCTLTRKGKSKYLLSSFDIAETTWVFEDKPLRSEDEIPTEEFIESFDELFPSRPNAAVTFMHEDNSMFDGPLVTAIVDAAERKKYGVVYELLQSKSQAEAYSLEEFFEDYDEEVTYVDCSIFIDSGGVDCGGTRASSCSKCPSTKCGGGGDCLKLLGMCTIVFYYACALYNLNCALFLLLKLFHYLPLCFLLTMQ